MNENLKPVSAKVSPELYLKLNNLAAKEQKPISSIIREILEKQDVGPASDEQCAVQLDCEPDKEPSDSSPDQSPINAISDEAPNIILEIDSPAEEDEPSPTATQEAVQESQDCGETKASELTEAEIEAAENAAWIAEISPPPDYIPVPTPYTHPRLFFDDEMATRVEAAHVTLAEIEQKIDANLEFYKNKLNYLKEVHIRELTRAQATATAHFENLRKRLMDQAAESTRPGYILLEQHWSCIKVGQRVVSEGKEILEGMIKTTAEHTAACNRTVKRVWVGMAIIGILLGIGFGVWQRHVEERASVEMRDWKNTASSLNYLITADLYPALPKRTQAAVDTFYAIHNILTPQRQEARAQQEESEQAQRTN